MNAIIDKIAAAIDLRINRYQAVSGGDISQAFLLNTSEGELFLKVNGDSQALDMFKSEARGLKAMEQTNTIKVPEVYQVGIAEGMSYLLMEAISPGPKTPGSMTRLGEALALMHKSSADQFGFDSDNYIGSLAQSNSWHTDWADFYVNERLIPQMSLAEKHHLLSSREIPSKASMIETCYGLTQNISPSLLHGDLWGGNYMITSEDQPVLIDPAVYYGHNEVDIAMTRLFGGFSSEFYRTYETHYPISEGYDKRMDLYQLYYLLVHLNLFGRSYYGSVSRLMKGLFRL